MPYTTLAYNSNENQQENDNPRSYGSNKITLTSNEVTACNFGLVSSQEYLLQNISPKNGENIT
jgi:hypothetical protein